MTQKYVIRRYGAYFRGWCQAFGMHESIFNENNGFYWLFSEHQVGFLLQSQIRKPLFKEILRKDETPTLSITQSHVRIGSFVHQFIGEADKHGYNKIENILTESKNCHIFLTSHLLYGTKARILTLSKIKPLYILYKDIGDVILTLN